MERDKGKMTREDAQRIQRATCKKNDGITPKGSFASRAMSAAYKNEPESSFQRTPQRKDSPPKAEAPEDQAGMSLLSKIGLFSVAALGFYALATSQEEKKQTSSRIPTPGDYSDDE